MLKVLIVLLIALGGFFGFRLVYGILVSHGDQPRQTVKLTASSESNYSRGCTGRGSVQFTSPPRRFEDIGLIEPIGLMIGGHVTPIDHGYYYPPNWQPEDDPVRFKDVLAPADGIISHLSFVGNKEGDYRMIIHHSCTFYTVYIHIKQLPEKIAQAAGEILNQNQINIPVSAGEIIGHANAVDFSVHNDEVSLTGFIIPRHYENEEWKIHTVDMFEYFVPDIKEKLLAKNIREKEPRGGKIDYDIDGRLVGNWFVEGTNGYPGRTNKIGNYWETHLAFAYDGLDPDLIVVSLGNFNGEAKQFAVKGNNPDPKDVSKANELVKYELVEIDYKDSATGAGWNRRGFVKGVKAFGRNEVLGTALVQMLEDRKIKFEVFLSKTSSEVSGFTAKAQIYER